ncbi:MAG: hypothetical protein IT196_24935 [Acidimicrobiales bacterium]|nr:hypothetical protein [Acidimicrobiales bacterium]
MIAVLPLLRRLLRALGTTPGAAIILVTTAAAVTAIAFRGRHLATRPPGFPGRGSPWFGIWRDSPMPWAALAAVAAVGAVVAWRWPRVCRTARWPVVLVLSAGLSAGWAMALAAVDGGWGQIAQPMTHKTEYLRAVDDMAEDPLGFLRSYVERLDERPIHVQGHPPGQVVVLWAMDAVGLGGPGWAAAQAIGLGAIAIPLVLTVTRRLVDEETARRAAVFCGFAPAVLTVATSTDAAFMGVAALTAAAATAMTSDRRGRSVGAGLATGVLVGVLLYLTYGGLTFLGPLLLPAAVLLRGRRPAPVLAALAGLAAVVGAFSAAGFWWFDGLAATREAYAAGVGSRRPQAYFVFANLAVLAVAVGPAALVGAPRLRDRRLALLIGAVCLGVAAANVSGLSKGEVERIWLPYMPWLVLAAAPLARSERSAQGWLAAQLLVGIAGQAAFRSPW